MTWTPLDVGFWRDRRVRKAGRDAALLYLAGLCHAQEELTDGLIERDVVDLLAASAWTTPASADRLVDVGLWVEDPEGWRVAGWAEWNKPAAEVRRLRDARGEGGRRGNHERWHVSRGLVVEGCRFCAASPTDGSDDRASDRPTDGTSDHLGDADRPADRSDVAPVSPPSPSPTPSHPPETKLERVLARLVDRRAEGARRSDGIGRGPAWRATTRAALEPDLVDRAAQLIEDFPGAPDDTIAARLEGDSVPHLAHYRRGPASG